ncbi:MAG: dephospho-CoA kinase [Peptococcaceae bacterium]|nr:dephospho-CoA kinase [Peptococcaceae bacterium]
MMRIGLTGGIASGKSSVAAWFRKKGISVFDADDAVHQIMAESVMISAIEKEFGSEYLINGEINRPLLALHVFQDQNMKTRLEKLLHPPVLEEMEKQCREAEKCGEKLIILDIPLLFEAGWDKFMDEIWVVYVPFSVQLERLILRNGLSGEEAERRIRSQMNLDEKAGKADRVIDNGGSREETEQQLESIWKDLIL